MAMKLHELRGARVTRNTLSIWTTKFVSFHGRMVFEEGTILELKKGLGACQQLKLPSDRTCSHTHCTDLLAVHDDRTLRPFSHLS